MDEILDKMSEKVVVIIRRLEEKDLREGKISRAADRIIARKMKKWGIPLTFYPTLLMRACGDPRIWGAVEELTDAATENQPGYVAGFILKGNGSGNK